MTLNDYQALAAATDKDTKLFVQEADGSYREVIGMYNGLALNGEAGELAEKLKKAARDGVPDDAKHRELVGKEVGDCLWYCAAVARKFGYTLDEIAQMNLEKIASRKQRGVLGGSGDER